MNYFAPKLINISNQKGVPLSNRVFLDNRSNNKLIVTKLSIILSYEQKHHVGYGFVLTQESLSSIA